MDESRIAQRVATDGQAPHPAPANVIAGVGELRMPTSSPDAPPETSIAPYWHERSVPRAPLTTSDSVDVAIVGAGYTGLWTAYYLLKSDPSLRIVLLEREHVGFGASGRNGGWASAIYPVSLDHLARSCGHDAALRLQEAMNDTVDEIGRIVAAEDIDAHYAKAGFLSLARSAAQLERARATVAASVRFGLPDQWRLLGAQESAALVGATGVSGGVYTPHCATVHPGRLVRGLADVVERMGARIHERTAVERFEKGRVITSGADIRANVVIRATEAYGCTFPGQRRSVVPLYSLVLATEPVPEPLRDRLGLSHRLAFNDMRHLRVYGQVAADGRIIFGGRGAPYHFGSRVSPRFDANDRIHAKIRAALVELFPALADVRITHRWGGALAVARDWQPSVGFDRATGIAWGGQYVGDGVATSNLAGRILRNLILGVDDPINALPLVDHRSPAWEIEPLRWMGVNGGLAMAALGDVEERVSGRPSRCARLLETLTGGH